MSECIEVVAYTRVSSAEQAKGQSLDGQRSFVQDYARRANLKIIKLFSESHSAYSPGRPKFDEMLRFIRRNPRIKAILAYKFDRLTRNMTDHATLSELSNIRIISATEALPEGATGEFLFNMSAVVSRFYSAQLAERTSLGMLTKCRKGLYPSLAPLGYVNVKEPPCIVPDPLRAEMVKEMFERYAESGASLAALEEWAERRGLVTRGGGKVRKSAIHKMLQNPLYYGTFRWGGELYEGRHEPIISRSTFDRCQQRLADKSHTVSKRRFPYRGLVFCGYCGCQLTAAYAKGKYIYYRCTQARGKCRQKYIRQDRLGDRLAVVVDGLHLERDQVSNLLSVVLENHERSSLRRRTRLDRLREQRRRLDERRDRAYTDKADGLLGKDRWLTLDRRWAAEDLLVKGEIEELESYRPPSVDDVEATLELLERAPDLYRRQSDEERARLLSALVWNLTITDESVDPVYKKPFSEVAQYASSANWYPRQDSNL